MKRTGFLLGCVVCTLAFFAAGCGSDSDSGGSEPENAVSLPKYQGGKIIKNKVVSVSGGDSGFVEYLEFESETAGKYHLYKDGAEVLESAKDFVYDPATGEFSAGSGANAVHSYMFEAKKDGEKVSVIAKDEMKCYAENPVLCAGWTVGSFVFSFDEEMNVSVKSAADGDGEGTEFSAGYSNEGGWVTIETVPDNIPLFYSSSNRFFFLAYATERSEVDGLGRNAASGEIVLVSPVFILSGIQL